jgi:D-aminopeptidase
MGRTGLTSDVGSGDLFVGFSTTEVFERTGNFEISAPTKRIVVDDDVLDGLYRATAEAAQAAIYDALFEAKTMTGQGGATVYGLPTDRVLQMLRSAGAITQ